MTDCRCGHPQDSHPDEHDGMCVAAHCECVAYRLKPLGAARPTSPPTLRDLIAAGRCSTRPKARRLAERIDTSIKALVLELRDEREKPKVVRVRREPRALNGPVICPECGAGCANGTGLSSHRRNAHRDIPTVLCPDCGKPIKANGVGPHRFRAHGVRRGEGTAA